MSIYIGVNGKARKVKSAYIGDAYGNAQVIYKAGIVPNGYIPVQYICNYHDNLNRIDTGIKANTYTRIICKISMGDGQISSNTVRFIGPNSDSGNMHIYKFYEYNHANNIQVVVGDKTATVTLGTSVHTLDLNRNANKESYFDNTLLFTNSISYTDESFIYLFAGSGLKDVRLHSCAIYQSMLTGVLTKNYIPCIRISDQRAGMWESVGGTFQPGSNTTVSSYFTSGPVITS